VRQAKKNENNQSCLNQKKCSPLVNEIFVFNDLIDLLDVWRETVLDMFPDGILTA